MGVAQASASAQAVHLQLRWQVATFTCRVLCGFELGFTPSIRTAADLMN